jgi:hypothetical protein
MKKYFIKCIGTAVVILLAFIGITGDGYCQLYHSNGDITHDGWCNMADLLVLTRYFYGCTSSNFCIDGGDVNGSGTVNGLDIPPLFNFLNGTGFVPIGVCPDVIVTCDINEQAEIWLEPVNNPNPDEATFSVFVEASSNVFALNFSYKYDPNDVSTFSVSNIHADVSDIFVTQRSVIAGVDVAAFLIDTHGSWNGASFPMGTGGTNIFDITLSRQTGSPNSTLLRILEDPIHGPPYFYFAAAGNCIGDDIICPLTPLILPCDANNSGGCNGLDVTFLVSYFKGQNSGPIVGYFYNVPVWWLF